MFEFGMRAIFFNNSDTMRVLPDPVGDLNVITAFSDLLRKVRAFSVNSPIALI
jgi:hypothetical protein